MENDFWFHVQLLKYISVLTNDVRFENVVQSLIHEPDQSRASVSCCCPIKFEEKSRSNQELLSWRLYKGTVADRAVSFLHWWTEEDMKIMYYTNSDQIRDLMKSIVDVDETHRQLLWVDGFVYIFDDLFGVRAVSDYQWLLSRFGPNTRIGEVWFWSWWRITRRCIYELAIIGFGWCFAHVYGRWMWFFLSWYLRSFQSWMRIVLAWFPRINSTCMACVVPSVTWWNLWGLGKPQWIDCSGGNRTHPTPSWGLNSAVVITGICVMSWKHWFLTSCINVIGGLFFLSCHWSWSGRFVRGI